MPGRKESKTRERMHFTKAAIAAIPAPADCRYLEVFDDEVKALGCRISTAGTMTMFVRKSIAGTPVKKTLGRFIPGAKGDQIERFRAEARGELAKIARDPKAWLHGEEKQDVESITLADAFDLALKVAKRGDLARRDWEVAKDRFLAWMKSNHPLLKLWVDLRRQHVREYLASRAGVSANRQRLDMQPVCQTSRHMANEYEIPDRAAGIELSNELKRPTEKVYLQDVLGFLDWLKERGEAHVEAGVALSALAGLRMFEVLVLRWEMVDLERALIETGTKNKYSHRVIPIHGRVAEALKRALDVRALKAVESMDGGPVVATPAEGAPYDQGKDSWHNYAKRVRSAIKAWCESLNAARIKAGGKAAVKIQWQVKNFRNVLPTLATLKGWMSPSVEQYLGHSAKGVTAKHYVPRLTAGSLGEAEELDQAMDSFRVLVVDLLDAEIKAIKVKLAGVAKDAAVVEMPGGK